MSQGNTVDADDDASIGAVADIAFDWLQRWENSAGQLTYMNKLGDSPDNPVVLHIDYRDLDRSAKEYQDASAIELLQRFQRDVKSAKLAFEQGCQRILREILGRQDPPEVICRFTNVEVFRIPIRSIGDQYVDRPVMVRGRVVSVSPKRPYILQFSYYCRDCEQEFTEMVRRFGQNLRFPSKCKECDRTRISQRSMDVKDLQIIKILDTRPSLVPIGVHLFVLDRDLCNIVVPGQVIDVFGTEAIDNHNPKANPVYMIEVNNIQNLHADDEIFNLTQEDVNRFRRWNTDGTENDNWIGNEPQFMEKFRDSYCPEVLGYDDIKHALIVQAVSLNPDDNQNLMSSRVIETLRGLMPSNSIGIFLVGSSSTAKSTLMIYHVKITPNSAYTSVSTSTEAGLTVSAGRDPETGYMMVEPGFLAKCHRGVAAMDEFDKHKKFVTEALHEAGSQKTISSSKGGFGGVVTLPADCAWLGGGNSKYGQWDESKDLQANLEYMPPSLITRFDLIFIMKDIPNEERDEGIAEKVMDNRSEDHWNKYLDDTEDRFGFITIKKYINYVNLHIPFPQIPEALREIIKKKYSKKRKDTKTLEIVNARYVSSLWKVAVSQARFMQDKEVTEQVIDDAMALLDKSLNESAFDPATGMLDGNIISGNRPKRLLTRDLTSKDAILWCFKEHAKKTLDGDDFMFSYEIQGMLTEHFGIPDEEGWEILKSQKDKIIYESFKSGKKGWRVLNG